MAKLYFRYACMNAGKTLNLMSTAFNYCERDQRAVVAKPTIDTKSHKVVSRAGMERDVDWHIDPDTSFLELLEEDSGHLTPLACIIVDEAQFLTPEQVDELFEIAVIHNVPVMAFGLRGDFRTHAFPGSARLLELAQSIEEIKTICRCGKKAMFNARRVDGKFVRDGATVAIDGQQAEYESLCGSCFYSKVGRPTAKTQ